jgi:hypothetical protein
MMKLRKRVDAIDYNDDNYFNSIGVFDTHRLNKNELVECIMNHIDYIYSRCPAKLRPEYFMVCADLSFEFVMRFPEHKNFNIVFIKKLQEMLDNPLLDTKQHSSINYYIKRIKEKV